MSMIGIDLGTTNSLVTYWDGKQASLIPNGLNKVMTPSIVGIDDNGEIIVGEVARQRLQTHSDKTLANFKRYMGSNKTFALGKNKFRPEELSALVLKSLKADAEAFLNEEVTDAVISVPAYFSDAQRKATQAAGQLAGLNVKRLINEPTAAAIAYGMHEKKDDITFLVFDIGGGTFDVSILELFDGVMQVNASSGDNRLGGEDFVDVLVRAFADHHDIKLDKLKGQQLANLRLSAENCKQVLTSEMHASMSIRVKKQNYDMSVSREQFNDFSADLLQRLRQPLERALNDADLHGDELDSIILVGGASRMPIIRSLASKMLGKIPSAHINPDEIVALGTAIQVGLIQNDEALKEIVLTDVSPYTLGVDIHNENDQDESGLLFHPIIERNSTVPISRSDLLYNASDNQSKIEICIYQGEARYVRENIKLGTLKLKIPRGRAGSESIDVRFTYDINGLLEVEVTVTSTGKKERVVIEGNPGLLTQKEIEQRLKSLQGLKIHPREKLENSVLMARGERLYENALGEKRAYIAELLQLFEKTLSKQDLAEIKSLVNEITEIFDQLEQDSPLH